MKKICLPTLALVLFLSLNLWAADKNLVCLATTTPDLTAPVEDNGAFLAVYAQIDENLVLKNIMIEDFPDSNDNETLHQQNQAVGAQVANSQIAYTLTNGGQLLLPANITNVGTCAGLLKNFDRFSDMTISLRCKVN